MVFAIGIGALVLPLIASFDKNAKCLLSRAANGTDILNTGTNTLETMSGICTNPPPTTSDGDHTWIFGTGCGSGPCTINTTQEKGKVYFVDKAPMYQPNYSKYSPILQHS